MLRPHAYDDVFRFRVRCDHPLDFGASVTSPNGRVSPIAVSLAGKKFMAGEPIKPATNRLAGRS